MHDLGYNHRSGFADPAKPTGENRKPTRPREACRPCEACRRVEKERDTLVRQAQSEAARLEPSTSTNLGSALQ
jgi:hypothetical protein